MPGDKASRGLPRGLLLMGPQRTDAVRQELERAGIEIEAAADGLAAVRAVERQPFDLVLCDLEVAGTGGLELLRSLRRCDPRVPVILLSRKGHPGPSPLEAAEQGAYLLEDPLAVPSLVRIALQQIRTYGAHVRTLTSSRILAGAVETVPATVAKNEFGRVLDTALLRGPVVITKHNVAKAVLISVHEYEDLTGEATPDLDALRSEFDHLLEHMQTPQAHAATDTLFAASPSMLGEAAVAEARKGKQPRERG